MTTTSTDADPPPDDDASTLARHGVLNLAGVIAYGVLNFALIVIVTRRLGAAAAGAFLLAIAVFNVLTRSSVLGADVGLLRFVPMLRARQRQAEVRHILATALVPVAAIAAVAGLAVFTLAEPLARLLSGGDGRADLETYLRVMALFIPVGAVYQALEGGSRGFGTMLPAVAVERFGRAGVTPLAMVAVFAGGLGSAAIALAWVGPMAVALVVLALWTAVLVRRLERSARAASVPDAGPAAEDRRRQRVGFWRFSLPRSLAGLFQLGVLWLDALLIGALGSTREAGIYAASTRWLVIGSFAGMAITMAFGPAVSFVLSTGDHERGRRLFETATSWFVALAWPPYLTIALFSPVLLTAFGRDFDAGATALAILGAAGLFAAAAGPVDMLLLMAGRSTSSLFNNGAALLVNLVLNLALIPTIGLTGAAIAWAASLVIRNALPLLQVHRQLDLHPFGHRWVVAVTAAGLGVGAPLLLARLVLGATLPALGLGLAVGAVAYVLLLHRYRDDLDVDSFVRSLRTRRPAPTAPDPVLVASAATDAN